MWSPSRPSAIVVSPVTGVVLEVNEELLDHPELLNSDPYGDWLIKVEQVTDTVEELLDAAADTRPSARRRADDGQLCSQHPRRAAARCCGPSACTTSAEALYGDVPAAMLSRTGRSISPSGMSELEVPRTMTRAGRGEPACFRTILRGAGAYDHYIPAIVKCYPGKGGVSDRLHALSGGDQPGHPPVHL